MNILYYIDSLNIGGAEMLLLSMLSEYKDQHNLHVAYFTDGALRERVERLGVPTTRLSQKGIKDPRALSRSIALIRNFQPDVIHTHLSKSHIVGQLTGQIMGVDVRVSSLHNADPWRENRFFSTLMRTLTGGSQRMIAVSEAVADYTLKWSQYPENKVVVIDNGIDLDKFDPAVVTPLELSPWNIPADAPVVGIIGRLHPQKAHHVFLQMAKQVLQAKPDVYFLVVGDGALREAHEAQSRSLGIDHRVIFTGFLQDIPGVLACLDILVFSSEWEGLPVTLLEAMAMKRPVVSTRAGGIPKVIDSGQNGLLVDVNDPDGLAQACLSILSDPALKQRLATQARHTVAKHYSQTLMHRKILDLYAELAAQPAL